MRNLKQFNKVLIGKWLWNFLTNTESLWVRMIKSVHGDLTKVDNGFVSMVGVGVAQVSGRM